MMSVLANYLDEKGHSVTFLVLHRSEKEYPLNENIACHFWEERKPADALGQIRFIRSYMKKNPGATFLSFFTHQNLYTIVAALGLHVKVVVSERNDPEYSIHGKGKKLLRRLLYASPMCHKLVFQTPGAADYFSRRIRRKSTIIANPLKEGLPEPYTGVRDKTVVSFGRFEPQKNYAMLIRAFAKFAHTWQDYRLILYGKGSQHGQLEELAQELGIREKVDFPGFSRNVHEQILSAGMFVLPSDYEGLSNSMLEAMAIGLPVICTDSPPGGARMFITHQENGILVPVRDEESLCGALTYMAEHQEQAKAMGQKAAGVRRDLETSRICEKWEAVVL